MKHVKKCKDKNKCCKGTLRQITEFASPYSLEMKKKMETKEYQKMFKKRSSTVEAPFGTLKVYYHMNEMPITGVQHTENILSLFAVTYNLKRLYNIMHEKYNETEDIHLFIENMGALLNLDCKTTTKK